MSEEKAKQQKFSVLLSLYAKEQADYLRTCLESLEKQSVKADEWLLVEDGPLTPELYAVLDEYEAKYPNILHRLALKENCGLGIALQKGVEACKYELIARMDTDDIAREDRFALQLKEFEKDPQLDICGSQIDEFTKDPQNIVSRRIVPLEDQEIKHYQKRRDAFNHMTVMFKKQTILDAGNYEHCPLMEDSLLWTKLCKHDAKCKNIDQSLVFARIGEDMYRRRGGLAYFKKYKKARKAILKTGYISYIDYLATIAPQFVVALMPNALRGWLFTTLLHPKKH